MSNFAIFPTSLHLNIKQLMDGWLYVNIQFFKREIKGQTYNYFTVRKNETQ